MKAHVQYSQSLAAEFADLIQDYEVLVEAPEDFVPEVQKVQEDVDLEAVCAVFEELMDNEPIAVLRALMPNGAEENAEEAAIEQEAVEQSHDDLIMNDSVEELYPLGSGELGLRRSRRIKKRRMQCSVDFNRHKTVNLRKIPYECTICNKRFSRKFVLKLHTRKHTGEKPYDCTICGMKFSHKIQLNRHSIIHTMVI